MITIHDVVAESVRGQLFTMPNIVTFTKNGLLRVMQAGRQAGLSGYHGMSFQ